MSKQSVYLIRNRDCPAEEMLIRKRPGPGARHQGSRLRPDVSGGSTVRHTRPDEGPILGALREIGREATPAAPARAAPGTQHGESRWGRPWDPTQRLDRAQDLHLEHGASVGVCAVRKIQRRTAGQQAAM